MVIITNYYFTVPLGTSMYACYFSYGARNTYVDVVELNGLNISKPGGSAIYVPQAQATNGYRQSRDYSGIITEGEQNEVYMSISGGWGAKKLATVILASD